ncbi:MAG: DUF4328 domain-containing protein [Acidobacteria bacterium]|nr:DUF4328 domain-containing protein [Acidobacteriota bacterium]
MQPAVSLHHQQSLAGLYASARSSAFWAKFWLGGIIGSRLMSIGLNSAEIVLIAVFPDTVTAALLRSEVDIGALPGGQLQIGVIFVSGLLLVFTMAHYVLSTLTFLRWQWNVSVNVPALTGTRPAIAPRWAVGSWFVPLANFIVPYWSAKELWRTSDPDVLAKGLPALVEPLHFEQVSSSLIVKWWVLFWGMLLSRAWAWHYTRQARDLGDWVMACWFELTASALTALAAWWAMTLIGEITERQEERFNNLLLQQRQRAAATE